MSKTKLQPIKVCKVCKVCKRCITAGKIDASFLRINIYGRFDAMVVCDFCGEERLRNEDDVKEIEEKNFCKKCYKRIFKK